MDAMFKRVKRGVLRSLRAAGAFDAIGHSKWRNRRLLVIGYHGVSIEDEHLWDSSYYIPADALETRLASLRSGGYNVLPLADAVEALRAGTLPPRSVVLTFDDGLADFALKAHPILRKYGYPATVYLSTYYTNFNRPVFGMFCSYLLWKAGRRSLRADAILPASPNQSWDLGTAAGRAAALGAITSHAERNGLSAVDKDELCQRIASALGVDFETLLNKRILRQVTPQEVRTLSEQGVDFQLHTHRHRTPVNPELFGREIEENREHLARMTGRQATHFCYPSGVYRPEFLSWLPQHGVRSATTCDSGIASPDSNLLLLPRLIDTSNLDLVEFESWTSGIGALLPRRPHRIPQSNHLA
jgi:peptidoglycan/xylan/chitin deacetylase (PgdA/CDA1 family)